MLQNLVDKLQVRLSQACLYISLYIIPHNTSAHSGTFWRKNSGIMLYYFSAFLPSTPAVADLTFVSVQDLGPSPQHLIPFDLYAKEWSQEISWVLCLFTIKGLLLVSLCPSPSLSSKNLEETCGRDRLFVSRTPRDLAFKNSFKFRLFSSYFCLFLPCSAKGERNSSCVPVFPQRALTPFGIQLFWLPCDFSSLDSK